MMYEASTSALPSVTSFTLVWIKIFEAAVDTHRNGVTSFTLVWIKMMNLNHGGDGRLVTSFTLVWIKMP